MAQIVALTTIDNPYIPFTDFVQWHLFDVEKCYKTAPQLARMDLRSDELSDADNALEIERAIDRIVSIDPLNIYIKVKEK